jgi:CBS domain-containing protein
LFARNRSFRDVPPRVALIRPGEEKEVKIMGTSVRDAMTPTVRTASPSQSLVDAAQMMKSDDAGSIPVVEEGRLVGIVTDRDIVIRAVAEGADPGATRIADIASGDLISVEPDQDLDEALALMARHQVRRLPVVDEDGHLVGILAQADVAFEAKEKKTGELLEQISQPTSTARE